MSFHISVKPTYTTSYFRFDHSPPVYHGNGEKHNAPAGIVTARAGRKLRVAIQWMLLCSTVKTVYSMKSKSCYKFRLAFITLTLSEMQKHSDCDVKNLMLRPFLKWMERQGCRLYVWKAETQKNGNIHFHITVDGFIHWLSIRKKWNNIQYKHGYSRAYEGQHGANSTDVHAVRNTKSLGSYIEKYMVKSQSDRRLISGRLWGCSEPLSKMKVVFNDDQPIFQDLCGYISHRSELKEMDFAKLYLHREKVWNVGPLRSYVNMLKRFSVTQKQYQIE